MPYYGKGGYSYKRSKSGYGSYCPPGGVTTVSDSTYAHQTGQRWLNMMSTGSFKDTPTMWPDRMMVKLRYLDRVNLRIDQGSSTTVPYNVGYRLNSPFSPRTAVTTQDIVAGYSEMASLYQNYRVHAVKITVDVENLSVALPLTGVLTLSPTLPNGIVATYSDMLSLVGNPYTVWASASSSNGNPKLHLENYVKLEKLLGQKSVSTDEEYAAAVNAIPVKVLLGNLYLRSPPTATSLSAPLQFSQINQIEYYCEFYNRITDVN